MKLRFTLLYFFSLFAFSSSVIAQQKLRLSVVVRDGVTKKPIPGASLLVAETKAGARADSAGVITLAHPPGVLTLYVSAVGYFRGRETIVLDFNKRVEYFLQPRSTDLEEVDVRATRKDKNIKDVQMGQILISMPELKRMPVVLGEPDILKALTLQSG
ncbi:carboxypeptidase-like regulatory domain-containing protein [Spirosoma telluris]|uniref:carboxypeptidase-like regulatory domain-containing protein n=1 Tax=Spirosoma telluris TaxID=2183553 RepID=UPI002FC2CFC2